MEKFEDDDDGVIVPVLIDREAMKRLTALARETGQHPLECASALLHDLLYDDAFANIGVLMRRLDS